MKPRRLSNTLLGLAVAISSFGCATTNPRVAMVVGNGRYEHSEPLANPANDALAVGDRLAALGWHVTRAIDMPAAELEKAAAAFEKETRRAKQAIFFYTGHSMQINGENFVVPIGFDPDHARLRRDLISLNDTIRRLERGPGQLAVFVDASREDPLAFEYERANRMRERTGRASEDGGAPAQLAFGSGLAEVPVDAGTYVAYSTAPGHVVLDSHGEHSPFARALLEFMDLPNQDVASILVLVRDQVVFDTGGTQVPWDQSSLTAPFELNPQAADASAP